MQRDFDDLLNESVVLGREGEFGLANAVILAEPNATFLVRWLDAYRSFRSKGKDEFWSEHSVLLPAKLAQAYPHEVTILPERPSSGPCGMTITSIGFSGPIGRSLGSDLCQPFVTGAGRRARPPTLQCYGRGGVSDVRTSA